MQEILERAQELLKSNYPENPTTAIDVLILVRDLIIELLPEKE